MRYGDSSTNPHLSDREGVVYWKLYSRLTNYWVDVAEPAHYRAEPEMAREVRIARAGAFEEFLVSWTHCTQVPLELEAGVIRLFSGRWDRARRFRNLCIGLAGVVAMAIFLLLIATSTKVGATGSSLYSIPLLSLNTLLVCLSLLAIGGHLRERRTCAGLISGDIFTSKDPLFASLLVEYGERFELGPALRDVLLRDGGMDFGVVGQEGSSLVKSLTEEWSQSFSELLMVVGSLTT